MSQQDHVSGLDEEARLADAPQNFNYLYPQRAPHQVAHQQEYPHFQVHMAHAVMGITA
jgi:hypothetical protein